MTDVYGRGVARATAGTAIDFGPARVLLFTLALVTGAFSGPFIGAAQAIPETEPNQPPAMAQNVDGFFSLTPDTLIGDMLGDTSTTIPHVTIEAVGNDDFDYFVFTVSAPNSRVIIDIDTASADEHFDSNLRLFSSSDMLFDIGDIEVASNNDNIYTYGQDGSAEDLPLGFSTDAYIETLLTTPGLYIVEVGSGSPVGGPVPDIPGYLLHISLEPGQIPEPGTLALFAMGLAGLFGFAGFRRGRGAKSRQL